MDADETTPPKGWALVRHLLAYLLSSMALSAFLFLPIVTLPASDLIDLEWLGAILGGLFFFGGIWPIMAWDNHWIQRPFHRKEPPYSWLVILPCAVMLYVPVVWLGSTVPDQINRRLDGTAPRVSETTVTGRPFEKRKRETSYFIEMDGSFAGKPVLRMKVPLGTWQATQLHQKVRLTWRPGALGWVWGTVELRPGL